MRKEGYKPSMVVDYLSEKYADEIGERIRKFQEEKNEILGNILNSYDPETDGDSSYPLPDDIRKELMKKHGLSGYWGSGNENKVNDENEE